MYTWCMRSWKRTKQAASKRASSEEAWGRGTPATKSLLAHEQSYRRHPWSVEGVWGIYICSTLYIPRVRLQALFAVPNAVEYSQGCYTGYPHWKLWLIDSYACYWTCCIAQCRIVSVSTTTRLTLPEYHRFYHPELRIRDCCFGSGKKAEPL